MVYNAMKLFMEINPQLFDDCSNEYTETQSSAEQRQLTRQHKWDIIAAQAKRKSGSVGTPSGEVPAPQGARRSRANSRAIAVPSSVPAVHEEGHLPMDPMTHDSQKRLDALKIQDEGGSDHVMGGSPSSKGQGGSRRLSDEHSRNTRNQR